MHRRDSQDLFYPRKGHQKGKHGLSGDLHLHKQSQDLTIYGQICGSICPMQRKIKQINDGLSRNQNSKTFHSMCCQFSISYQRISASQLHTDNLEVVSWKRHLLEKKRVSAWNIKMWTCGDRSTSPLKLKSHELTETHTCKNAAREDGSWAKACCFGRRHGRWIGWERCWRWGRCVRRDHCRAGEGPATEGVRGG